VRYLSEGSIRKAGNRIRIVAQLSKSLTQDVDQGVPARGVVKCKFSRTRGALRLCLLWMALGPGINVFARARTLTHSARGAFVSPVPTPLKAACRAC
jgi:hypothetical protein